MNDDLFACLPLEITIDILSKLPVRTTICCKCVCKSWLKIVETHFSKVFPALAVYGFRSNLCSIFDIGDGLDIENHELLDNPVIKFDRPHREAVFNGSANGLLFLVNQKTNHHSLYICNPITRDYIKIHCPLVSRHRFVLTYGFGVSRITGLYKVVRIFQNYASDPKLNPHLICKKSECECHVYTLGTVSWRRVAPVAPFLYERRMDGAFFLNGNLHWLVSGWDGFQQRILFFDVETELFSTFSPPPPLMRKGIYRCLFALGDCLCLSDNSSLDEVVIWSMKKYSDEKSWTRDFVISKDSLVCDDLSGLIHDDVIYPFKVFKNGDLLMVLAHLVLMYYSKKCGTTQKIGMLGWHGGIKACLYTPSLLSLQSFVSK